MSTVNPATNPPANNPQDFGDPGVPKIDAEKMKEVDKMIDTDGDGQLSDEEIKAALQDPEKAAKIREALGLSPDSTDAEVTAVLNGNQPSTTPA
jgi:hypothetical protein